MARLQRTPLKDDGPQPDVLIVEGSDDFHVFISLFDQYAVRGKCRLEDGGGYERIRDSIDTRIDESGLERIGFIIDADEDVSDRWNSLRQILINQCGYLQVPNTPEPNGTILRQDGKVTLGLWLMPDNVISGALEEFIRRLIPEEDSLWRYAMTCVDNLPVLPERRTDNWMSKACIHTWLAWQKEPGKPIGQAITKKYLDAQSEAAKQLIEWMKRLFDVPH